MSDEDVILNDDALTNERMTGDLAALPDAGIFLDFDECADLGFVSNLAAIQIDELRKANVLSQSHVVRNAVVGVHKYTSDPRLVND
jgi:hypothetical protein